MPRPLGELDLDHFHLLVRRLTLEGDRVEASVRGPAAEISGGDLPDQVAAMPAVVPADGPLAGIVGKAPLPGPEIEGLDGIAAHRPEARAGDVEQGRLIGLFAVTAANGHAEIVAGRLLRRDGMGDPPVARGIDVADASERLLVEHVLGALVDHRPLFPAEGDRVALVLDQILTDFRTDGLQDEADMPDDRIVPEDCMGGLQQVMQADQHQRSQG